MASFYETEGSVRRVLSEVHKSMDVERLERERTVVIVDTLNKYFAVDGENLKVWYGQVQKKGWQRKCGSKKRILCFG